MKPETMKKRPGPKPKPDQYQTLSQAAGAMGVPPEVLKAAKRAGCPAFHASGRVDGPEFREWMQQHGDSLTVAAPESSLKDKLLAEQVRKYKIHNDSKMELLVSRAKVADAVAKILKAADAMIEQKLVNEWPQFVAGLDPAGARAYGKRLGDALRAELGKLGEHFRDE
jgi:hypothetical protein